MKLFTKRNQSGFTIIEVMIVLAIAGVIMLALFLAVPALQRNSRNNQRSSDAALIAASVNECLNNRNGLRDSCDNIAELRLNGGHDSTKLRQLSDGTATSPNVTVTTGAPAAIPAAQTNTAIVAFGRQCAADGASAAAGGGTRAFVVLYNIENSGGTGILRCLTS
jgi:prepilin-type N-terminal cleavage/methylation domain-containing protein